MAEFQEVIKNRNRMCGISCCDYCELKIRFGNCWDGIEEKTKEYEEIIMKWTEEHPIKTNADKFKEVFGGELYKLVGCADCRYCQSTSNEHKGFWNSEYKGDK